MKSLLFSLCVSFWAVAISGHGWAVLLVQHSSDNVIKGDYSDAKAMALLFGQYDAATKASPVEPTPDECRVFGVEDEDRLTAKLVFSSPVYRQGGQDRRILLFALTPGDYGDYVCHACAPVVGGAIFVRSARGWQLFSVTRNIEQFGSYGMVPDTAKLIQLGP